MTDDDERQIVTKGSDIPNIRESVHDAANHSENISMRYFYFLIRKEGATSYLRRKMKATLFGGKLRMMG